MADNKRDEIRDKLGINDLDNHEQKKIFTKFVNAGGQVVDLTENEKREARRREEEKLRQSAANPDGKYSYVRSQQSAARPGQSTAKPAVRKAAVKEENPLALWLERFFTKIGCIINGIIQWNEMDFNTRFQELILISMQNVFINSRMVLASLIHQDKVFAAEVRKRLSADTSSPYAFELIYRFDTVYTDEFFAKLLVMKRAGNPVKEAKPLLLELYRSLYVLQPYVFSLKAACEKALNIEKEIRRIDPLTTSGNIHKMYYNIDFVFQKVYSRLFQLIDYYYKEETRFKDISFKDFIALREEDQMGYYAARWKTELEAQIRADEEKPRKSAPVPAPGTIGAQQAAAADMGDEDPVKKGLDIITGLIDFAQLRRTAVEKKDPKALFSLNDKVFLTIVLLDFFDKEFSFIFNSSKVAFNVVFNAGNREDLRRELMDHYYRINSILERGNEYLKILREVRKMDKDTFMRTDERSSRYNQYSIQRSQVSRQLRKEARELFEEFTKRFLYISNDCRTARRIIQNGQDVLEFNKRVDGDRLANGRTVNDIIDIALNYSSAMRFLMTDGDLGGMTILIEKPQYLRLDMASDAGSMEADD